MGLLFRVREPQAWQATLDLCRRIANAGGRAHLVGGSVRDALLELEVHDFDLEVFGLAPGELRELVEGRHAVDLVGESFGVLKLRRLPIDVGLPRRESKAGVGHRAFETLSDPSMSVCEAASRRDFTINAIAYDPLLEELIDPFGGEQDLRAGLLRHTSAKFAEDPLRVLRGMQLVARFGLASDPGTIELCRTMLLENLPRSRIFEEWKKLLLLGTQPRLGLEFLRATDWLRYFPELEVLIGCPQDPEWHPEGDVWVHTGHVLDAFARLRLGEPWEDLVVGLACLCHDLGKPATTRMELGRWRSKGHEEAGQEPTLTLLARITDHGRLPAEVVPLVVDHLKPRQLYESRAGDAAIRRLARRVGRIDRLVRVAEADADGRPPLPRGDDLAGPWLLDQSRRLEVADAAPKPIVMGRHLIDRGFEPGPSFKGILEQCFEAQLDGRFVDLEGGLAYLDRLVADSAAATGKAE